MAKILFYTDNGVYDSLHNEESVKDSTLLDYYIYFFEEEE